VRALGPGARIGRDVTVIAHLHRSRALDVYDAWSDERGCRCTVKTVRPDRLRDRDVVRGLLHEGRLLATMSHPHIVRAYEVRDSPRPALVLETLGGETLAHLVESAPKPLSPAELGHLGLQVGSALRYLHGRRILHLDLKPSNVIVESGRAKLIDLSHAGAPGPAPAGRGTWCYMAPEQARGKPVTTAADVWGLGAVLYESAAGRAAFGDEDGDEEVDFPQLHRRATSVRRRRRLPAPLGDVIDACLEPDPEQRPHLQELLAACEQAAELPAEERRLGEPRAWIASSAEPEGITDTRGGRVGPPRSHCGAP
jgi:serine/threonine protein kinase